MNKRLFSVLSIWLFFCMFGASGQVSADSVADFLKEVIGTYEGEVTWDGGSSPYTTTIFQEGTPVEYDQQAVSAAMRDEEQVVIALRFPFGEASTRFWTCDLTTEYVRLNSEYTT